MKEESYWEDPNPIDFEQDVLDRRLYLSKQKKVKYLTRIKNSFIRKVVSEYIGEDFFMCSKETQQVMLDWAIQKFYEDEPKRKKEKWIKGNYTLSEMINGRRGRGGARMKCSENPCKFCGKKFISSISLKNHISKNHPRENYDVKDLQIDKLKLEIMRVNAGRKRFFKNINSMIKRARNFQEQIDIKKFNDEIRIYNKDVKNVKKVLSNLSPPFKLAFGVLR